MRIGIFDSGLGGLAIAQAIIRRLPQYDYLYLGDTKRVPYGGRSQETIHEFVAEALGFLFGRDCQIVILACNTASAESLRKSQQEYLPNHYPDRRVLGMIIPTAEAAFEQGDPDTIGILATSSTVESDAYGRELRSRMPGIAVIQQAAPLLVPLIENGGLRFLDPILDEYLDPMSRSDTILLGCTHYCLIKEQVRARTSARVISQDEVIPEKTASYLANHPEIEQALSRTGGRRYMVTDLGPGYGELARTMSGEDIELERVSL